MRLSKKRLALLTACVFSALSSCAFAAEADELETYDASEYVVTATRTPLEKKEVPMAVEVIDAEEISKTGAYSVKDALRFANNIDVTESGMTGNEVKVRGMSSNKVLILIDGRRMAAENTSSTQNAYELSRINIDDVERIEVIRGNGSALYGSDAMAGVINIITKKATQERFIIGAHTGTKDAAANFSYASGRQGKISVKASAGVEKIRERHADYVEDGEYNDSTNMYGVRRFLNLGFDYALTEKTGLAFDMNFMREDQVSTSVAGSDFASYKYDNHRSDYALTYYGKDDKNDWMVRAYYNELKKDQSTVENSEYTDWDTFSYDTFVIEAKNSQKLDDHNTLTYGAEYNITNMDGTRLGGKGDSPFTTIKWDIEKEGSEKDVKTYALYLQDELRVGDKLLLIPAVRFDHHDAFGSEVSPKLGATYNFSDNSRVKINYGRSFRAPTVYELYATMDKRMGMMNVEVYGNEDLDPEKAVNFDISLEAEQGKGSAKIGYFHNKISNLITYSDYTYSYGSSGITIHTEYINVEKAVIQGFEAELGYRFSDKWNLRATYNYIDAIDKSAGERLSGRARHNGLVQLNYTDGTLNPWTGTMWLHYNDDYKYDDDYTLSYTTLNMVVDKQINRNLHIYAGVDNIFDKDLPYDADHTYYLDGRTWRVGAQWTF